MIITFALVRVPLGVQTCQVLHLGTETREVSRDKQSRVIILVKTPAVLYTLHLVAQYPLLNLQIYSCYEY